jgi:hypothetical protein
LKYRWLIIVAVLTLVGCSSDPDSPVGTEFIEDGIIGSLPGDVVLDTLRLGPGDQSFFIASRLDVNTTLSIGNKDGYQSSILLKINFNSPGLDISRTVELARLRLRAASDSEIDSLTANFFELLSAYDEGDTVKVLDIGPAAIPDSGLVEVDRQLPTALGLYTLPTGLVQDWIRGIKPHNGLAVVATAGTIDRHLLMGARESSAGDRRPILEVKFTDGNSTLYKISDDGTFVESVNPTQNLVLSDAYIRRIYLPLDLTQLDPDLLIHEAKLILNYVPSSSLGSDFSVFLYSPNDANPMSTGIWTGQGITTGLVDFINGKVVLPVRNVMLLILGGQEENNGFALRFMGEGSELRQVEFYTSASDSLGPRIELISSHPPEFNK